MAKQRSNSDQIYYSSKGPATAPSLLSAAWQFRSLSQWSAAETICRQALLKEPGSSEALHLLGLLANDQGDPALAVCRFERTIALDPFQPLHYNNLAVVLLSLGRHEDAAAHLVKALSLDPSYRDAKSNLGLTLFHQGKLNRAEQCFKEILSVPPVSKTALANLGMVRLAMQKYTGAAETYEQAIGIDPVHPGWHSNLGAAYMRMSLFEKAVASFRQAITLDDENLEYQINLGIALRACGKLDESILALERVVSKDPKRSSAIANLVVGLEYTCQWDKLELFHPLLGLATDCALQNGRLPDEDPMQNIRRSDDPALNQAVCRAWSRDIQRRAERIKLRFSPRYGNSRKNRITVGYFSHDFRNHPVVHQLWPLFRMHDRKRFRVICFSTGPDDNSRHRREVMNGCDEFLDISSYGLQEAAQAIYNFEIDILVDLMGHSHHNRMEIFALRPAPVQIGYLGFLSTTGAKFIDYLIADHVVVPKNHEPFYDEKLIRMPRCYQMNHTYRTDDARNPERQEWGLTDSVFVFCCFNSAYKIDRAVFDAWMRILLKTPHAILWLNGGHPMAASQMRMRAERLGIDPGRLIFAEKVALETHLSRLSLADLALDTVGYNGGATTANALAAGIPVITVMGCHWVSRMSASHLLAAGMPDMVFDSLQSYEEAAVYLAHHPEKLLFAKQRLGASAETNGLLDAHYFVRSLEIGYESAWRRYVNGQEPDHIDIRNRLEVHE